MTETASPQSPNPSGSGADRTTEQIADRLHSAAIHLLRRVRDVDQELGLSAARLSCLSYLVFGGPASVGELARFEQVTAASISQMVNVLVRDGLAERMEDPRDGRGTLVVATPQGGKVMKRGREARVRVLTALLQGLGAPDLKTLERAAELIEGRVRG